MDDFPAFSRPFPIADIPPEGAHAQVDAEAAERAAIARVADLVDLPRLHGHFELAHLPGGGVRVSGLVEADVVQTCVVTLEPVEGKVREEVCVRFVPAEQIAAPSHSDDTEVDPDEASDLEPLEGFSVDLGKLTLEFMLLGLDPYPRKDGALFDSPPPRDDDDKRHPFAALAGLRDKLKDDPKT